MSENERMILGQEGEMSGGNVIEGVRIDSGEVQGICGGERIVIKKGEIVSELEMDDPLKIGSQVVFAADETDVGGNNDGDSNVTGGTWVGRNFDEVVPEVEVDRAGNDGDVVAVGTMNEVYHVVDEMCSGDISVGRNEYDNMAFEHFNSEGLNLVVDLGDLYGLEDEFMQRNIPIEKLNSNKDVYKSNIVSVRPKARSKECQTAKDGEYYCSDMVWGKVRGHPWWPGQIFEPSAASAKAAKLFKKGTYLVAYFGDQTFAWNEPAAMKPFRTHYVRMAKQSTLEAFSEAVDCALEEVSRRVEYGLSCSCLPADQLAKIEYQPFINSGIRHESTRRCGIGKDASLFKPTELLQDIGLLAANPFHEIDKLRFVTVRAQLLAFNHWKGFDHLPDIVELYGLGDGDGDIHTLGKKSSVHMHDKGEGRTRRAIQDVSTLKYKRISDVGLGGSSIMVDGENGSISSGKKIKANKSVSGGIMFRSKKVLSHWDQKESSSRLSNYVGNMPRPEEILEKLSLAAASPMEGHRIMRPLTSFLSYYRNTICLEHKNGGKRKRSDVEQFGEKSFELEAVKMNEFEGIEDSYMIPNVAGEVELGAENAAEVGENSEEYTPTELILKFSDLESIPPIKELNKIFSRYGPLDEPRSMLFGKSKRAKVVFKRRSHAETAFSSSGKFSIFGHSLLGYSLKASTSSARNKKVTKSANGK